MRRNVAASILIIALLVFSGLFEFTQGQSMSRNSAGLASTPSLRLTLPLKEGSVRFAVIGDTGSGSSGQQDVADMMAQYRAVFPFEFVLLAGDNIYGSESARDMERKFSRVYEKLLDADVKFYAALGNHDNPNQIFYEHFNMNGKEYYRFKKGDVAFYALNSNYMDKRQVEWLINELAQDNSKWKITFFHHPPYSSGRKHGSDNQLRDIVEPIFVRLGVNAVFTGHDHFYERIKPQKGIYYFVSGAGGKLRTGNVRSSSSLTEKAFDTDMHFMLVEISEDELHFQVISRTGATVDSGVLINQQKKI